MRGFCRYLRGREGTVFLVGLTDHEENHGSCYYPKQYDYDRRLVEREWWMVDNSVLVAISGIDTPGHRIHSKADTRSLSGKHRNTYPQSLDPLLLKGQQMVMCTRSDLATWSSRNRHCTPDIKDGKKENLNDCSSSKTYPVHEPLDVSGDGYPRGTNTLIIVVDGPK